MSPEAGNLFANIRNAYSHATAAALNRGLFSASSDNLGTKKCGEEISPEQQPRYTEKVLGDTVMSMNT